MSTWQKAKTCVYLPLVVITKLYKPLNTSQMNLNSHSMASFIGVPKREKDNFSPYRSVPACRLGVVVDVVLGSVLSEGFLPSRRKHVVVDNLLGF